MRPRPRISLAQRARQQVVSSLRPAPLGGCTPQTPRCADARDYGAELRPCCRAHLRRIVADTLPVLAEFGVTVWADYGTLLGAVRNPLTTWKDYPWLPQDNRGTGPLLPGIIPHDKDADFSIFMPGVANNMAFYTLSRIRSKLERMGYYATAHHQGRTLKVRLSHSNGTNVDFFRWLEKPDGIMYRIKYAHGDTFKGRHFHRDTLFPLSTVQWEGMTLPAPKDPQAFAAFRYGPTWLTPVRANHGGVRIP